MASIVFGRPTFVVPIMPAGNIDAKCIVQFRPRSGWKGEFGFDWFRIGDTSLGGDENYETLIGQYYDKALIDDTKERNGNSNSWTAFFKADPQPAGFTVFENTNAIKNLYGEYTYSLENDASGNPVTKKYYKPVMTLFPKVVDPANPNKVLESGEAKLELYLEFQKIDGRKVKPDKVVFEMDNTLMDASHPLVNIDKHTILKKDLDSKIDIKLTCTAEFTYDREIKVWAITLDEAGNEKTKLSAGILKMIAPSKKTTKEVVIVRVTTSIGTGSRKELDFFKRNLKQALIAVNVTEQTPNALGRLEEIKIDVRSVTKIDVTAATHSNVTIDFETEFNVDKNNNIVTENWTPPHGVDIQEYLKTELELKYPGQFTNHFQLFFLENTCDFFEINDSSGNTLQTGTTKGFSNFNSNTGIMFSGHSEGTIAHECMHGLGLHHSFFAFKFCYKALKTDNIMDYSNSDTDKVTGLPSTVLDRISTWFWQWKVLNINI
jgi:hypothetical protein